MPMDASAKSGLSGMPAGRRLLDEGDDLVGGVDMHDAEARGLHARHFEAAHRHVRRGIDVLAQHQLVIHLVDVVAARITMYSGP